MIVGINCGHTVSGSIGSGASGILDESNETRNVGRRLEEYLQKRGVTVVDCTNDYAATVNENLSKITAMANARNLDLFVSIHFNSGGGRGSEVYTYGARRLAAARELSNCCGISRRWTIQTAAIAAANEIGRSNRRGLFQKFQINFFRFIYWKARQIKCRA